MNQKFPDQVLFAVFDTTLEKHMCPIANVGGLLEPFTNRAS
jgi:hypothetical protein